MGNKKPDKKIIPAKHVKRFSRESKVFGPVVLVLAILAWQTMQQPVVRYEMSRLKYRLASHADVQGLMILKQDVPFLKQEHSLSCEIAALRQALAGQGINVPESDLINLLPFDPTPKKNGVWGDPDAGFVGDIDGKMPYNGYGVHWDPITKVGSHFVRTETVNGFTPKQIARNLQEGNIVVSWGFVGKGNQLAWKTPAGRDITVANGEHARTIYGFTGTVNDPAGFYVMDPRYGDQYWSTEDLMDNWEPFGHNGVVVYKNPQYIKTADNNQVWEIAKDGKSKTKIANPDQSIPVVTVTQDKLDSYPENILQNTTN